MPLESPSHVVGVGSSRVGRGGGLGLSLCWHSGSSASPGAFLYHFETPRLVSVEARAHLRTTGVSQTLYSVKQAFMVCFAISLALLCDTSRECLDLLDKKPYFPNFKSVLGLALWPSRLSRCPQHCHPIAGLSPCCSASHKAPY